MNQKPVTYSFIDQDILESLADLETAYNESPSKGKAKEIAYHQYTCATKALSPEVLAQVEAIIEKRHEDEQRLSRKQDAVKAYWRKSGKKPELHTFMSVVLYLATLESDTDDVFRALEGGLGSLVYGKTEEQLDAAMRLFKQAEKE